MNNKICLLLILIIFCLPKSLLGGITEGQVKIILGDYWIKMITDNRLSLLDLHKIKKRIDQVPVSKLLSDFQKSKGQRKEFILKKIQVEMPKRYNKREVAGLNYNELTELFEIFSFVMTQYLGGKIEDTMMFPIEIDNMMIGGPAYFDENSKVNPMEIPDDSVACYHSVQG